MIEKSFIRSFEDWRGLEYVTTALTKQPGRFIVAENVVRGIGKSLRKRPGSQSIAQPEIKFRALHRASFLNPDEEQTEELLGINHQGWRLVPGTITITPPGGVSLRYTAYWESENVFRFRLYNGSTPYVLSGTDTFLDSTWTLLDLVEKVGALAGFSVASSVPYARVNGLQTIPASVGTTAVTIDSGHTLTIDTYTDTPSGVSGLGRVGFYIYATAATTFTVPRWPTQAVTLADNAVIGGLSTSITALNNRRTSVSATTLSFLYWVPICYPWSDEQRVGLIAAANRTPLPTLSIGNISLFSFPNSVGGTSAMEVDEYGEKDYILDTPEVDNKIQKYDGQNLYRAGLTVDVKTVSNLGAGGVTAGVHSWKYVYKNIDQVGNIVVSRPYDCGSLTLAGASQIQITGTAATNTIEQTMCAKGAYASGAQVGVNTIVVDTNATAGWTRPNIDVGDYVSFRESTVAPPRLTRRLVTAVVRSAAPYSITIDGAVVTIDDNEPISVNMTLELYRTEAGGVTHYYAGEYAMPPYLGTVIDDIGDSALGPALEEPLLGEEPLPPPRCVAMCEHQGKLVLSGDSNFPNTVVYSLASSIESFNPGTHAFDVPSSAGGAITGIASDTSGRMAVFKRRAYYDIIGDLSTGIIERNTISEENLGAVTHKVVCKTPTGLIAISDRGLIEINDGQIVNYHYELSPFFRAGAFTSAELGSQSVGSFLRTLQSYRTNGSSTGVLNFNVDYSVPPQFITTATPNSACIPYYGWTEYQGRAYSIDRAVGTVFREHDGSDLSDPRDMYNEGGTGENIVQSLYIVGDVLDTPSIDKYPLRVRIFSLYNQFEDGKFTPVVGTLKVITGLRSDDIDPATVHQTMNLTYAALTDTVQQEDGKIISTKTPVVSFLIEDDTFNASMHITGYELVANLPYKPEDNL